MQKMVVNAFFMTGSSLQFVWIEKATANQNRQLADGLATHLLSLGQMGFSRGSNV
jgi:hypothetical protein